MKSSIELEYNKRGDKWINMTSSSSEMKVFEAVLSDSILPKNEENSKEIRHEIQAERKKKERKSHQNVFIDEKHWMKGAVIMTTMTTLNVMMESEFSALELQIW